MNLMGVMFCRLVSQRCTKALTSVIRQECRCPPLSSDYRVDTFRKIFFFDTPTPSPKERGASNGYLILNLM